MPEPITFDSYSAEFPNVALQRTDGILVMRLHSGGGPCQWSPDVTVQMERAFDRVAKDPQNRIVVLTGTGEWFTGPRRELNPQRPIVTQNDWDSDRRGARALLENLLRIEAPVIGAVNGPAVRHAELPLLSDIVIATPDAEFTDQGHFAGGLAPGDGHQVIMPAAIGLNRARYYLLTGQTIGAEEALRIGLINEIVPKEQIMERALDLATMIGQQPPLTLRHTRLILTQTLRRQMFEQLEYGLILEEMAASQ